MATASLTTEQLLANLAATPVRLSELTLWLTPAQARARPSPGEWSVTEVLAHLRACADVWGDAMLRILADERPTLRAVNPTTWIEQTDYRELEFLPSWAEFATQRQDLLDVLGTLAPADWAREALVTGGGAPRARSLRSFADRMARHERPHLKQVERIVKALNQEQSPPPAAS